jgi:hypothetical protein
MHTRPVAAQAWRIRHICCNAFFDVRLMPFSDDHFVDAGVFLLLWSGTPGVSAPGPGEFFNGQRTSPTGVVA